MKTQDEEIREARRAEALVNDPLFKQAMDGIESTIIDRMRKVPIGDIDTQHELVLTLQLLGSLRQSFNAMIQTGKMAEIQKDQSIAQKVKRFVRP
jgi:hypothetical protein